MSAQRRAFVLCCSGGFAETSISHSFRNRPGGAEGSAPWEVFIVNADEAIPALYQFGIHTTPCMMVPRPRSKPL